jgi:hypothetical protein
LWIAERSVLSGFRIPLSAIEMRLWPNIQASIFQIESRGGGTRRTLQFSIAEIGLWIVERGVLSAIRSPLSIAAPVAE